MIDAFTHDIAVEGSGKEMKNTGDQYRFFILFPRIIKSMFEVDKRYLFVSSAVTIIQSLAPAISLLIMQQIINLIQQGIQSITFILQLVVLYVCIDLASTIISGLMNYYTTKFSLKFNLHIKDCIMQKASQLSLWHYENSNTYDKIKLAEGANGGTLMSQFTSFTTLIGQAITSLSYIVILLHFNYIIILIIVIRKAWYYSFIVTNGTHFKELKTYNLLNYFIKKYDDLYKKFNQQDAAIAKETMVKMTSLSIIEQIITGAIFAYIIYCGFVGGILLGDVVAYTRAAISNQTNIQSILQNISSIKKSNLYIGQYYSFIDLENAKTLDEGKIIIDKIHSLKLENLSFKYDTGGYVLKNVNLRKEIVMQL